MTNLQRLGIMIYILVIIQNVATLTIFFVRVKPSAARRSLVISQFSIILWLFLGVFEILFQRTEFLPVIVRVIIINLYFIGPLWFICTLYILKLFSKHLRWIRWVVLFPAFISALPSFFDQLSHLAIRRIENMEIVADWGIILYINTGLLFVYILTSSLLILLYSSRERLNFWIRLLLVLSMFIPVVTIILNHYSLIPDAGINSVPVTLAFFTAIIALAILRYEMIDIRPAASYAVFRNIHEAVLIIDRNGNILDQNPATQSFFSEFQTPETPQNLPDFLKLLGEACGDSTIQKKICESLKYRNPQFLDDPVKLLQKNGSIIELSCSVLPLFDEHNNSLLGHIICFSDVTILREATINAERIRLASDLHDNIGHSLNSISLNVEYALSQQLSRNHISSMLNIAYERSQQALLDLRRIVEELKPIDIDYFGLLDSLEQMSSRYNHLPVNIQLSFEGVNEALIRQTQTGESIYFICMEAVNNAIRHGKAQSIDIILAYRQGRILLLISDDGQGGEKLVEGNGLKNIKRRVCSLGGICEYGYISEGGFNIMINLPAKQVKEKGFIK